MALPYNRNETYAPGVPPSHITMNDLQDAEVDLKHGGIIEHIPACAMDVYFDGVGDTELRGHYWRVNGIFSRKIYVPLAYHKGTRLTAVKFFLYEGNATAISCFIYSCDGTDGTSTDEGGGANASPGTSGFQQVTITGGNLPLILLVNNSYYAVVIFPGVVDGRIYHAEVTYDRP